jgi:hypothetical protein
MANTPERTDTFLKLTGNLMALAFWLLVVIVFGSIFVILAWDTLGWVAVVGVAIFLILGLRIVFPGRTKSPHQP